MLRFQDISTDTLDAHWQRSTLPQGLIAILAIAPLLLAGYFSGHNAAGAIAAGGAFTVGFAVFHPALRSQILSMVFATLAMATATYAGSLSAEWTWATLIVVAIAGLNYGLLSGLGASAGWIGQQAAVYLVISTYFPNGPRLALGRASMILLGGTVQILVHIAFRVRITPTTGRRLCLVAIARTHSYLKRLPQHLTLGSETLSYVARMVLTITIATAIYRDMGLQNGYWVPMTAMLCLKPQWTGTVSRSVARVTGTLSGATIAYGLSHWHHWNIWILAALVLIAALGCYALQDVNYALFSMAMTLYIVFVFRFGGFSETRAAHLRLLNTAIGGTLALLIDSLWQALAAPLFLHQDPEPLHLE